MDKGEYRITIVLEKAPKQGWWNLGALFKKRIVRGVNLSELQEINWNRIIFSLVEGIEEQIKEMEERRNQYISTEEK